MERQKLPLTGKNVYDTFESLSNSVKENVMVLDGKQEKQVPLLCPLHADSKAAKAGSGYERSIAGGQGDCILPLHGVLEAQ